MNGLNLAGKEKNYYMRKIELLEMLCSQCNIVKPISDIFSVKSGLCKKCRSSNLYIANKEEYIKRSREYYKKLISTEEGKNKIREIKGKQMREWRANNPDKQKLANKRKYASVKANPEKYKKQLESSRLLHRERKYNESNKRYRDRSKENLTDNYIKRLLLNRKISYSYNDIPQEYIDLKRKELQLERKLKNQNYVKSNENN